MEIARAIASRPRVLLLDEPAAGLNPEEVLALIDFIRLIKERFQLSILVIEHRMDLIMTLCDTIYVQDFGRTIAVGPPAKIQKDPAVLAAYLGEEAVEAIHGVDMDAEAGKITVIIGSNGAGKSTLLGAISGMVKRTGTIRFDGKNLPGASHRVVSAGVIQVPEGRSIFAGLTVEENLRLGAYLNSSARQVRGLMARPRLLLLDEPSLGLAPIIVGEVFDTIRHIRDEGITVILVEQNAKKSLSICDYAYVLENGRMVKSGPGRQMLDDPDIAAAYLGVREE